MRIATFQSCLLHVHNSNFCRHRNRKNCIKWNMKSCQHVALTSSDSDPISFDNVTGQQASCRRDLQFSLACTGVSSLDSLQQILVAKTNSLWLLNSVNVYDNYSALRDIVVNYLQSGHYNRNNIQLRFEFRKPSAEQTRKYVEQIIAESRHGTVLNLGSWVSS